MWNDIEAFFIRLGHALSDPAIPAWVQAVGSLVAIAVVFWIERLERRRETARLRHEAETRAEHLAVALSAYMAEFHQQVIQASRKVRSAENNKEVLDRIDRRELSVQVPHVIEDAWDRLGELGPVLGAAIVELLARAMQYQQAVSERPWPHPIDWVESKANLHRMEVLVDQTIIPGLAKLRDRFIKRSGA